MIICPFISQLPLNEQHQWIEKLNRVFLLNKLNVNVVIANEISKQQKEHCEFAIVANPKPEDLKAYSHLVWVQSLWAGVEKLVADLSTYSFTIVRLVDPVLSQIMSEAVLAWTLYLHRQMPLYLSQQKKNQWEQHQHVLPQERTVAILGLGKLGKASAAVLHYHGFKVTGWSQSQKNIKGVHCYWGGNGIVEASKNADIVVCLLPHTDKTHRLLNKTFFNTLKRGVSLINFSRGGLIKYSDLTEQLHCRHIKHAVLDVFDQEPLSENSELWQHEHITVLPHISAPTHMNSAVNIVENNVSAFIETRVIPKGINKTKGY